MRLWVLEANRQARRFYERFGFVADGERSTYPLDVPDRDPVLLPELRYTLTLDHSGADPG